LPQKEGHACQYDEATRAWTYVENHVGAVVFDPVTGAEVTIKHYGPIAAYATEPKPSAYHEWQPKTRQWKITKAKQAQLATEREAQQAAEGAFEVQQRCAQATQELATLQYRVELDRASAEHLAQITVLKGYVCKS